MLSVHTCEGEVRQPMTAEEMQHSWQQIGILEAEMKFDRRVGILGPAA